MLDCWINIGNCLPFSWAYTENFYERAQLCLIGLGLIKIETMFKTMTAMLAFHDPMPRRLL
jgi:hypothetical protein